MRGIVRGRKPFISVTFRIPGSPDIALDFIIDTGFEGALTLPPPAIAALGLSFDQPMIAKTADGRRTTVPTFRATILWNGLVLIVQVLEMSNPPLLGTLLLDNNDLFIRFRDGGEVLIGPSP